MIGAVPDIPGEFVRDNNALKEKVASLLQLKSYKYCILILQKKR
jgi:hypothetical protein